MKNGYQLLSLLHNKLEDNNLLISSMLEKDRESFSNDENMINIATAIISEIKEIAYALDQEVFILNKDLYNLLMPIAKYADNMFNQYKFVNAYKLYDVLKIDVKNLKDFLDKIKR